MFLQNFGELVCLGGIQFYGLEWQVDVVLLDGEGVFMVVVLECFEQGIVVFEGMFFDFGVQLLCLGYEDILCFFEFFEYFVELVGVCCIVEY